MIPFGLTLVTAPTETPLSLTEAKGFLRILGNDSENDVITALQNAAVDFIQRVTGKQLLTATYRASYDGFPGGRNGEYRPPSWRFGTIRLPRSPLQSVSTITYVDTNGDQQTLAGTEYQVDATTEPGRIAPARFKVWPIADPYTLASVKVTFVAGYTSASVLPDAFKQATRLLLGHLYENREATIEASLNQIPLGLREFIRSITLAEYR